MFEQYFNAHEDKNRAADYFRNRFVFRSEHVADFNADGGESEGSGTDKRVAHQILADRNAKVTPTASASMLVAIAISSMVLNPNGFPPFSPRRRFCTPL